MSNEQSILNPKTDWVFKLMFSKGEEGNKALISFLNAFLEDSYGKINNPDASVWVVVLIRWLQSALIPFVTTQASGY